MFYILITLLWLFMFFFQFRSEEKQNSYVDMKNYTFCSNLIFKYPRWLVLLLFFNYRLTMFPLTILLGQMLNCIVFLTCCILFICGCTEFFTVLLKIYMYSFIVLSIVMCVDHEIFCLRKK